MLSALITTITIIIVGFLSGALLRRRVPAYLGQINFWCTRLAVQGAIPFSLLLAIWQLEEIKGQLFLLTIIGTAVILSGGLIAWLLGRYLNLTQLQMGAYIPTGFFMNLGAVGVFCVFAVLGEDGLALVPFYKLFEEVIYFTIAFPLAARLGTRAKASPRPFWRDPFLLTTLSAVSIGFILNLMGIPRPEILAHVSGIVVPLGTYLLMISVGLVFEFRGMKGLWRPALGMAIIRTLVGPTLVLTLSTLLGLWQINQGLPVKVALLLSIMPTAFLSLLPPVLYGVDQKIANTSWFASSLVFLAAFPFALLLLQQF